MPQSLLLGLTKKLQQYWACLAFICLAVPPEHPFWTEEEESAWGSIPPVKALKHPGHIMRYVWPSLRGLNSKTHKFMPATWAAIACFSRRVRLAGIQ